MPRPEPGRPSPTCAGGPREAAFTWRPRPRPRFRPGRRLWVGERGPEPESLRSSQRHVCSDAGAPGRAGRQLPAHADDELRRNAESGLLQRGNRSADDRASGIPAPARRVPTVLRARCELHQCHLGLALAGRPIFDRFELGLLLTERRTVRPGHESRRHVWPAKSGRAVVSRIRRNDGQHVRRSGLWLSACAAGRNVSVLERRRARAP